MEHPISVWPIIFLALLHLFGSRLSFLSGLPRSVWLSVAGGVSVAYVFLHLFPELGEGQEHIQRNMETADFLRTATYLEHHIYLVALIGLAVFYGLEKSVVSSKKENKAKGDEEKADAGVFWVHIGSFAFYNALIGFILFQREEGAVQEMVLFSIAMALHFIVNDYALQEHHKEDYRRFGRWLLVASLVAGWAAGFMISEPGLLVHVLMAFVGGGVVLNVLKEELPEERKSRYWAFVLGAGAYAVLLLAL